jgi:ATP-dependent RNA helicase DeaD
MTDEQKKSRPRGGSGRGRGDRSRGRSGGGRSSSGGGRRPSKKSGRRDDRTVSDRRSTTGEPEPIPAGLPATEFSKFELAPPIEAAVAAVGYVEPSPIQDQMIPLVLAEKNVVGRAQTGTGKTAAFLVPLLAMLDEVEDESFIAAGQPKGPVRVLVVVPTRELAIQVAEESEKLTRFVPVRTVCCYGGAPMDQQIRALRNSAIVVGTPGRLLDHIRRGNADFGHLDAVVLDEVDRMYDLGFRDDVDKILAVCKQRDQTILTSATLNEDVERLIKKHVPEHETVVIETKSLTVESIDQTFYFVEPHRKQELMIAVVTELKPEKGIVFVRTRFSVDRLTYQLKQRGVNAELLHSGIPQRSRERILKGFREDKFPLLIATDVASRGLDIDDVTHVFNYDVPQSAEDYVHRVGRTARMGKSGAAVTFITRDDGPILTAIEKLINKEIRQEVFPGFEAAPKKTAAKKKAAAKKPPGMPPWANPARRRR